MKSVQRHNLETNWLAKHLKVWIDRAEPYMSRIIGVVVAIVVVVLVWSWFAGSSASRQLEAWDLYNAVIGQQSLTAQTLTQLNRAAEEYQDTDMQQLADLTWADGQVWNSSRDILHDRKAALSVLDGAISTYQAIIDTSSNNRFVDRAHFGLARVYELRNEPGKAREEYLKVRSTYDALAKRRADELAKEKTKKTLEWLALAEAPRVAGPLGAGTPGQRPAFDVEDFALPAATGATPSAPAGGTSVEDFLKGFDQLGIGTGETTPDRYNLGEAPTDQKAAEGDKSKSDAGTPAPVDSKAPAGGQPPAQPGKSGTSETPTGGAAKGGAGK
jgi:hypothetical protein